MNVNPDTRNCCTEIKTFIPGFRIIFISLRIYYISFSRFFLDPAAIIQEGFLKRTHPPADAYGFGKSYAL